MSIVKVFNTQPELAQPVFCRLVSGTQFSIESILPKDERSLDLFWLILPKGRQVLRSFIIIETCCERLSRNAVFWLRGRGFRHWWCLDRDAFHADA
jgi:hypothetical protein